MTMLTLHHVGTLVDSIDASVAMYRSLFLYSKFSDKVYISSERVFVCFIEIAPDVYLELIEPADEGSVVSKMKKKGISYYHLAYQVAHFEETIEVLLKMNFKQVSAFDSEAFDNKRCSFFMSPDMHLIEIVEK